MGGSRIDLWVSGSGNASVAEIEADRLDLSLSGSGKVVLAGKAAQARVTVHGAGNVDAHGLTVADADVTMAGAGDVTLSATRSEERRVGKDCGSPCSSRCWPLPTHIQTIYQPILKLTHLTKNN